MKLSDINEYRNQETQTRLTDLLKYSKTLQFQRKVNMSMQCLEEFFKTVKNPIVSCGGGKDGTATALLASQFCPSVKILCANPPNPLTDRDDHLYNLKHYLKCDWHDISYDWDVISVLDGKTPYPQSLKVKALKNWIKDNDVDGVIMGLRNSENQRRSINYAMRGEMYKTENVCHCLPIAKWSPEEALCLALMFDAPINPVYEKMEGVGNLDYLHDGTWWPHSSSQNWWVKRYYPECYPYLEKAEKLEIAKVN